MILTPAQAQIATDLHRFRVVNIGRRGGKTTLAVEEIKGKAISKPTRIAYIAPTYQQARDIAWETLKKELQGAIKNINDSRLEIKTKTLKGGESLIVLRGWESIETMRGQAFDFLVIDEVAMMRNFWVSWQEVLRPTLTDTRGEALFISTPKGFNHFYDLYNLSLKDKDFKSFHFTSYDNPNIPAEEIDAAKAQITPERFQQEYLAMFAKTQGLVYKEFNREKHLYETLPEKSFTKLVGVDFGYVNPAGVLEVMYDGEDFYVEDEWYKTQRTEVQIAEYVAALNGNAVYPDPESPSAIEELRRKGVNVREVVKGKDSIKSGIQKVRELFLGGRLHVNKKCQNLVHELESYSYDDETGDKNEQENPLKANDHLMDALRYVIMMTEPGKRGPTYVQAPPEVGEFEGGESGYKGPEGFLQNPYQPAEFEQ